jgi:hypothetical protein
MRRSIFFIGIIFLFSTCAVNTESDLSFDLDSFELQAFNRNEAERFAPDGLLLGRPTALRLHADGFVVIEDMTEHQVTIADLRDRSTQGFIMRGRGPMEMITARGIAIENGNVWVSGIQENKMVKLAPDRNTRRFAAVEEYILSGSEFLRAMPYRDSLFLILSNISSGKRMEILNKKGESVETVGSFPDVRMSGNRALNNAWLQSEITISSDNRHTAVVCKSVDYIDIYDSNMELKKRLRGPMGADPEFMERQLPNGIQFVQSPMFFVYETIVSNDKTFFVGYNGVEVKSETDFETEAHRILSFDWNGQPLKCYTFDHPVWCFDIDADSRKIYVATRNGETLEPEILIYNL